MKLFFVLCIFILSINLFAEVNSKKETIGSSGSNNNLTLIKYLPSDANIEFVAIGRPAMLKIKGKSSNLTGQIETEKNHVQVELNLDLKTLTTDNETRDSHMKEKYLEINQYPLASLKITDLIVNENMNQIGYNQKNIPFNGVLTLHGQSKQVDGFYDVDVQAKEISIATKFNILITDFKIEIPSFAGVKVADKVEIETHFKLKKINKN